VISPNPQVVFPALFVFVLVGVWFLLVTLLWRRLVTRQSAVYESMNQPNFFAVLGVLSTMRFIFLRRHRGLGDKTLALISDLALTVFAVYTLGLVLLISIFND
jgi:hypothetical protein